MLSILYCYHADNVAEGLRRQIRNLLGFPRVGSNPAIVDRCNLLHFLDLYQNVYLFAIFSCLSSKCVVLPVVQLCTVQRHIV